MAPVHAAPALGTARAVLVFGAFAFAYFFSALLRAVTATLAPVFSAELGLPAAQLGLLGGAYFLGFALTQLPLGSALDRFGPRRVLLAFLSAAVLGCLAFAQADGLWPLLAARFLIGVGVSACLMAPLTCYRRRFSAASQLRANSWMLMAGSLGMVASTVPVQWLLPQLGWRGLFLVVAACLLLSMVAIRLAVPADLPQAPVDQATQDNGYFRVFRHPVMRRLAPMGLVAYGGLIAMQALWIGPWLTQVGGHSASGAAQGLLIVNLAMLAAFLGWGLVTPRLVRAGWDGERLLATIWPASALCLAWIIWLGPQAGAWHWAVWCVCSSAVSLSQPAVGHAFSAGLAGRALSAFNLMIFAGVFALQWGIGLLIDALQALGWARLTCYRVAMLCFLLALAAAGAWLNLGRWRSGAGQPIRGSDGGQ